MVSGKEHVVFDDDEMIEYYIKDITNNTQKTFNTGSSIIIIKNIEEFRVEPDFDSMS